MAISFSKREKERKRVQKRREKQRRREERKAKGPATFKEMIAYVDAEGNICDTPPEIEEEEVIELEDIQVSVPKQEVTEPRFPIGTIKYYDTRKGIGFIRQNDYPDDLFFHHSNAPKDIKLGDVVSYEVEQGLRGPNAVNICHYNN